MATWKWAVVIVWNCLLCQELVYGCSWSNEGCTDDNDCCSKSCHRAHEGTNPRCRHSTLGERCVFDYHCQNTLTCGQHFNCCSPYWKMCMKDSDCCEKEHVCRPVEGFYYKRCLFPSGSATPLFTKNSWTVTFVLTLTSVVHWINHFPGEGHYSVYGDQ